MEENRRLLRVERELREVISSYLVGRTKQPLPGLAAVIHVDASSDLRSAKVFVKIAGDESIEKSTSKVLEDERTDIQHFVSKELKLRFCPVLKFIVGGAKDGPLDEIDQMLAALHKPRY